MHSLFCSQDLRGERETNDWKFIYLSSFFNSLACFCDYRNKQSRVKDRSEGYFSQFFHAWQLTGIRLLYTGTSFQQSLKHNELTDKRS